MTTAFLPRLLSSRVFLIGSLVFLIVGSPQVLAVVPQQPPVKPAIQARAIPLNLKVAPRAAVAELNAAAQDKVEAVHEKEQEKQEPSSSAVEVDTADLIRRDEVVIGDQNIRFHIWNGLIIGGDLVIEHIDVETEFGSLKIPIAKIQRIFPGLDSFPELEEKIQKLVEGLGDKNFDVREKSHAELVEMGPLIRLEIERFDDGGSVERKKHLTEIKKKIEEMIDDADQLDDSIDSPLIRGDRIQTDQFTIVGKIVQPEFRMKSKYGDMVVQLSDIKMGDRAFHVTASEIRRTVEVDGMNFFPDAINTKIRVNRGDRISIEATGTVNWTNWNAACGPEGMSDKGQFAGHNSGMLLARIGDGSDYIKVGSKTTFVAPRSGILYLGIAMAENYSRNTGYRWTGNYSTKIKIQPQN